MRDETGVPQYLLSLRTFSVVSAIAGRLIRLIAGVKGHRVMGGASVHSLVARGDTVRSVVVSDACGMCM